MSNQYAERDLIELDEHYANHIIALSIEQLNSKSDIAAELAFRDQRIAKLESLLKAVKNELSSLQREVQTVNHPK